VVLTALEHAIATMSEPATENGAGPDGLDVEAGDITLLLAEWRAGSRAALERLLERVYAELRRLAAERLTGRKIALDPTELVNELMLRLLREPPLARDRRHFFRIAALAFRQLLVDQARRAMAQRRQCEITEITLERVSAPFATVSIERWLDIEAALRELEGLDQRKARVCELVLLMGITQRDAADVLEISLATLERELRFVRAWLGERLAP
jgi:RNA polymerase sigma factor (TIGR02999 family)